MPKNIAIGKRRPQSSPYSVSIFYTISAYLQHKSANPAFLICKIFVKKLDRFLILTRWSCGSAPPRDILNAVPDDGREIWPKTCGTNWNLIKNSELWETDFVFVVFFNMYCRPGPFQLPPVDQTWPLHCPNYRSLDSTVTTVPVVRLRAEQSGSRGSILCRSITFLFAQRPNRNWGPPSVLSWGTRELLNLE